MARISRPRLAVASATALCLLGPAAAGGQPAARVALKSHGQRLRLLHRHDVRLNASQSGNWFGYNQGSLEQGGKLFHSITGDWIVPTARQHKKGQAESSSDWIGIGGGCVDSGCTLTDPTLIQTGTEQDVSSTGSRSYSSWWELVPAPSVDTGMTIKPGDRMHASIAELVAGSNVWTITLRDVTRHESFSSTVPYTSTHATAEWIEETPLLLGTNPGLASLPKLSSPVFDHATANGQQAALKASEQIDLTDSASKVIAVPSATDPDRDGFNACTWTTSCRAPISS